MMLGERDDVMEERSGVSPERIDRDAARSVVWRDRTLRSMALSDMRAERRHPGKPHASLHPTQCDVFTARDDHSPATRDLRPIERPLYSPKARPSPGMYDRNAGM